MPKFKSTDELKSASNIGKARRREKRIIDRIEKTPAGRFSICPVCGEQFEQVWRQKLGRYTQYDRCGKCRMHHARGKSLEVAPYTPHPGQQLIHESPVRFKLANCGARWGKDRCMIMEFIQKFGLMLSEQDRGADLVPRVYGWIVAPTYRMARQNWREIKKFFPKRWMAKDPYESDQVIETVGDGIIEVRSADDPESLVGVGLDIVLITEAARIKNLEQVWANIETRLMSPGRGINGTGGIGLLNSTPRGMNYWYKMWTWGQKNLPEYDKDWESWSFPSFDNPYLGEKDHKFFERMRKRYPDRIYRQEVLAEFLPEGNSVFPTADREMNFYIGDHQPQPGETYVIGYDPARVTDFSGVAIRNSQGECVKILQWTGKPFTAQTDEIAVLSRMYNYAHVVIDKTGLGEALPEALVQRGISVEPIHFTHQMKEALVNNLAMLIEQESIKYPKHDALVAELKDYEYKTTKTGITRYGNATSTGNDDLVTALMLAFKDYNIPQVTIPFMGLLAGVPKNMRLM